MRYFEIVDKYKQTQQLLIELDFEYAEKPKGDTYSKRKIQLIDKLDDLQKKAKQLGTSGNICHITGKRSRPNAKNNKLQVQENFNLYFTNITEEEASALVKLHIKNLVYYKITFIRPGVIITSS